LKGLATAFFITRSFEMGTINSDLRMYRDALSQKMRKSQWHQIPVWGSMIGHLGGMDDHGYLRSVPYGSVQAKTLRPTGMPIEVLTDWNHMGGHAIDVPVKLPLRQEPIYGDNQAEGQEEDFTWVYNRCLINQVRRPVKTRDGLMGEQALTPRMLMQIWDNLKDEFVSFNQRWQAYAPYDACYRGFSANILASKAKGGFGDVIKQKSHPNFYVAGYGRVPFNADPATYESAIATELDNLGSDDKMTVQVIRNAQIYGSRHMIVPTTAGNYKVKGVMIINDAQMAQLAEDPLFEKLHIALITKDGTGAALFTGAYEAHLIEGVLILVDINNPGVWTSGETYYDSARGTINYGNVNPLENPIHQSDRKLALYIGASAILCGHTVPLGFKNRTADYDNVKGESSFTVVGYTRADRYDHDGFLSASEFLGNTSGIVIATSSPNNPSWGAAVAGSTPAV
jgi:hypothetical protein